MGRTQFSLFFFGSDAGVTAAPGKYQLLLDSTKLADASSLVAAWVPERHFQRFGGLFGSPSVIAAALAISTRRLRIRAGSVVLPLQHPLRVAEEWSIIDNLSGGRIDMAIASGWHPDDFVLNPTAYARRYEDIDEKLAIIEELWSGRSISLPNGVGEQVDVTITPLPLQPKINFWFTVQGDDGFANAAKRGFNILTSNFAQEHKPDLLARRIAAYRKEMLERHGRPGTVTLMSHAFVGTRAHIDAVVEVKMFEYQFEMAELLAKVRPGAPPKVASRLSGETESYRRRAAGAGARRIIDSPLSLIGTQDECRARAATLAELGVDEIACLIDFGLDYETTMTSVGELAALAES